MTDTHPAGFKTFSLDTYQSLLAPTFNGKSAEVIATCPFTAYLKRTTNVDFAKGFEIVPKPAEPTSSFSLSLKAGERMLVGTPKGVLTVKTGFNGRVGVQSDDYVPYIGEDRLFTKQPTKIQAFYNRLALMHLQQVPTGKTVNWVKGQGLQKPLETMLVQSVESNGIAKTLDVLYDTLSPKAANKTPKGRALKASQR